MLFIAIVHIIIIIIMFQLYIVCTLPPGMQLFVMCNFRFCTFAPCVFYTGDMLIGNRRHFVNGVGSWIM